MNNNKSENSKLKIIISVLLILLLGVGCIIFYLSKDGKNLLNINNTTTTTDPIKHYHASLIATGDGLLHRPVYRAGYNEKTKGYDFTSMLEYTKEVLKDYDIKYYNQETVFDDDKEYSNFPRFNTPSQYGTDMINAGFNLVSLATNHSMDMGGASAKKHADWWKNQKDVYATGMASSEEDRNDFKILNANGITYTMLNYTYGTNGLGKSEIKKEPYIVNLIDKDQIKKDIESVRDNVDVLIVAMHWGSEYRLEPTNKQKELAKFLADNGVDIVIGTHSHCLEPWERIGDTVVFYSLGNFISDQIDLETDYLRSIAVYGVFATLDINKTVDTRTNETKITINNIGADLNTTIRFKQKNEFNSYPYSFTVMPFSEMNDDTLSKYNYYTVGSRGNMKKTYKKDYEFLSETLKKYDDSINIAPLKDNVKIEDTNAD